MDYSLVCFMLTTLYKNFGDAYGKDVKIITNLLQSLMNINDYLVI